MFSVLHVHYHIDVFCRRNLELGQQKEIVRFILHHPVQLSGFISSYVVQSSSVLAG